jgi:drug/metabolite transporter (DMT)-like permease
MTPTAIILVTISAFTHALWNLLGKRSNPAASFFLVSTLTGAIFLSPLVIRWRAALPAIPSPVWALLGITALCQMVYYVGLAGAYRSGDMSVAYPLARALPALLIAMITAALGIQKPISGLGLAGILMVGAGCLMVPLQSFRSLRLESYLNSCCLWALVAAVGTTGYTLIDSQALARLRASPGIGLSNAQIAFLFLALDTAVTALWLAIYTLSRAPERDRMRTTWQRNRRQAALAGLIIAGTYGLVLTAMTYATNVSYIAAFRNLGIALGALLGIVVQGEPGYRPKLLGIAILLAGLACIALA